MTEPLLYKPEHAAEVLGIGRSKIFELIHRGDIGSVRIGRSRRISRAALEEYVAQLEQNATPAA